MNQQNFLQIGNYFKTKREDSGLTQQEIADKLGYGSKQLISNWERGLCSPPLNKLAELVKILDLNEREVIKVFLDETQSLLQSKLKMKRKKSGKRHS